jgi:hypothetical protein
MQFCDALTLDAPRRTKDGYLVVRAKAARTGVYEYTGREIDPQNKHGLRDTAVVKVLRDDATVFDAAAVRSFIGKPVTDDHPAQPVTADNWRQHARGAVMGAMRDGEYLSFDLMLADASAIRKVEGGKRELSNGYAAEIEFGDFAAPDGTKCQARQARIIGGNHVALVDRGRAGPDCAIKDRFAVCDANPEAIAPLSNHKETPAMAGTIIVDGLPVSLADEAAVRAVLAKKDAAIEAADKAVADAKAVASTLSGEKAALEKALADEKARTEPAALDKLVADRADLVAKAKAAKSDIVTDGKTDVEIRRAVVESALGDAAKGMDDAAISGAFAVVTKDAKPGTATAKADPIARPASFADTASIAAAARAGRYAN